METSSPDVSGLPALMLLADGRFPTGGYAHSGGFEPTAHREGVHEVDGMEEFLLGRLNTTGLIAAAFAAAACQQFHRWADGENALNLSDALAPFDAEFEARTPPPVLRTVSRRLGRQLIRTGRKVWPHRGLERLASMPGNGLHQPIAFGAVAAAAGQSPQHTAVAAAQEAVAGPATAAVRLLGLDPFDVNASIARLGSDIANVGVVAAEFAASAAADLPARSGYLLDISAVFHSTWEVRLFAS